MSLKLIAHSVYEFLFHLPSNSRYLFCAVSYLLLIVLWYFFVYVAMNSMLKHQRAESDKERIICDDLKKRYESLKELDELTAQYNREIFTTIKRLPHANVTLDAIKKLINEHALKTISLVRGKKENSRLFFFQNFECKIQGSYRQLLLFFKALESNFPIIRFSLLLLEKEQKFLSSTVTLSCIAKKGLRS